MIHFRFKSSVNTYATRKMSIFVEFHTQTLFHPCTTFSRARSEIYCIYHIPLIFSWPQEMELSGFASSSFSPTSASFDLSPWTPTKLASDWKSMSSTCFRPPGCCCCCCCCFRRRLETFASERTRTDFAQRLAEAKT